MPASAVGAKLEAAAHQYSSESIVVKKDGAEIWFDNTRFRFEDGKLKSVGRE